MTLSDSISRRAFLQMLGLGSAGLALGGSAAWAQAQLAEQAAAQHTIATLQTALTEVEGSRLTLDQSVLNLQQQLTALEAQLGAATSQNAQLAGALAEAQKKLGGLQAQLSEAQDRLASATERLGYFKELLALYDQLEAVGLDGLLRDGLAAVSGGLAGALGIGPLVRAGLQTARDLLAELEKLLPDFNTALAWLSDQVIKVKVKLFGVELTAQKVVADSAVTGVVALFGGFAKFVLDNLPFNIGEKVRASLDATQGLVTQTTALADGANKNVFDKMSRHVADGPQGLKRRVAAPIREKALTPAADLLSALESANATFAASLNTPAQAALKSRAALRDQIARFRAQHRLE
jgi:hypothetical protein